MENSRMAKWRKLDNAAKIFPATSDKLDPRVFRFTGELKETIKKEILQLALDETIKIYPMLCSVMRKGLFWFYLEKSDLKPMVEEECKPPCSSIYIRDKKSLLFEVTYYKNNINVEVYHALTDGAGAVQFVTDLVKNYITLAHFEEFPEGIVKREQEITDADREADAFTKYYSNDRKTVKGKKVKAHQLTGAKVPQGEMRITQGIVSVKEILAKTKEYGVSLTVFLTAVYIFSIYKEMNNWQKKRPVVLMVPINLRQFFPSETMLNFFGWINAGYQFDKNDATLDSVIEGISDFFKQELTKEKVEMRMNKLAKLEHNFFLRLTPLEMKTLTMQAAAGLAKSDTTAIISNIGILKFPEEFENYIELFSAYTSTPKKELCICSFKDNLSLSFTSHFENTSIERGFFRILEELGLEVKEYIPEIPKPKQTSNQTAMFFKGFSFACIAIVLIAAGINLMVTPDILWSLFVAGGILCTWLATAVGYFKRRNPVKNAIWQMLLVGIGSMIWDLVTGWHKWSIDYILPGIIVLTMISLLTITKIQKLKTPDYMIYYVMAGIFGLVPLILYFTGCLLITYPSVVCGVISLLFLSALLIFRKEDLFREMHKKFHL